MRFLHRKCNEKEKTTEAATVAAAANIAEPMSGWLGVVTMPVFGSGSDRCAEMWVHRIIQHECVHISWYVILTPV